MVFSTLSPYAVIPSIGSIYSVCSWAACNPFVFANSVLGYLITATSRPSGPANPHLASVDSGNSAISNPFFIFHPADVTSFISYTFEDETNSSELESPPHAAKRKINININGKNFFIFNPYDFNFSNF